MDKLILHSKQANEVRYGDMLNEAESILVESYLDGSFNNDTDEVARSKLRVLLDDINGYRVKHLAVKEGSFDFGSWLPRIEAIAKMNYALVPLNEAGVFSNVRFSMRSDGRYIVFCGGECITFPDLLGDYNERGFGVMALRQQCQDHDRNGLAKIAKTLAGVKPELYSSHYATKTRFIRQVCDYIYTDGRSKNKRPSSWEVEHRFSYNCLDEQPNPSYLPSEKGRELLKAVGEMGNRLIKMDIIDDNEWEEDED